MFITESYTQKGICRLILHTFIQLTVAISLSVFYFQCADLCCFLSINQIASLRTQRRRRELPFDLFYFTSTETIFTMTLSLVLSREVRFEVSAISDPVRSVRYEI